MEQEQDRQRADVIDLHRWEVERKRACRRWEAARRLERRHMAYVPWDQRKVLWRITRGHLVITLGWLFVVLLAGIAGGLD